ncbi:peptidyl-tRNA hydrolase PTH2-domain-containing protein [Scheffersomyces amazonensis]|uniref:peptidyl-tRNA hydrolase PTH2-domain-containing protein n=1 Tax=Scheffersomyces amazonensis TaxID=1078765 RepID=UPI00315C4D65
MGQTSIVSLAAVAGVSFVAGYYINQLRDYGSNLNYKRQGYRRIKSNSSSSTSSNSTDDYTDDDDEEEEEDSEDEGIDIDSTNLNEVPGEVRMTLIVRQDLKMGKGKAAAQCSHATLALYKKITNPQSAAYNPDMVQRWEYGNGQAKITLQVPNQEEMDTLFAQAISLGINAYIVHDAGRTQIAAGSATVLGLGPAPKAVIDQITSDLKLY